MAKKVAAVLAFIVCIMTCLCMLTGCKWENLVYNPDETPEEEYKELPYHYKYPGTATQEFLHREENRIAVGPYRNINYDPAVDDGNDEFFYYVDLTLPQKRVIFINNRQQLDEAIDPASWQSTEIDFETQMVVVLIFSECSGIKYRLADIKIEDRTMTFVYYEWHPNHQVSAPIVLSEVGGGIRQVGCD